MVNIVIRAKAAKDGLRDQENLRWPTVPNCNSGQYPIAKTGSYLWSSNDPAVDTPLHGCLNLLRGSFDLKYVSCSKTSSRTGSRYVDHPQSQLLLIIVSDTAHI
jgi:hypothetical protein